jgi:putative NADH-flavin reductase
MRVLIIGASRGLGLETVRTALRAGHRVRAFARSADRIGVSDRNLEKRRGDALSAVDVASALDGVDAVIQTLGVPVRDLMAKVSLFSEATAVLAPAMERRGVRRLIAVTGFGAGESRRAIHWTQLGPFSLFLGRAYDDKGAQERLIEESALDWTIVRPGVLLPGPETGRYKVLAEPSQWRGGVVSRPDVADFLVKQLASSDYLRKAPVLVWV